MYQAIPTHLLGKSHVVITHKCFTVFEDKDAQLLTGRVAIHIDQVMVVICQWLYEASNRLWVLWYKRDLQEEEGVTTGARRDLRLPTLPSTMSETMRNFLYASSMMCDMAMAGVVMHTSKKYKARS